MRARERKTTLSRGINISVYAPIVRTRAAYRFDAGAFLMRIYTAMVTIGSVSMLTLQGHSVLLSGSVSSTIALATFLISPRVSRRIDERGQSAIIPGATVIAMAGLLLLLATSSLRLPWALNYLGGVCMGFVPNAPALARTRWTYLIKGHGGTQAPQVSMKTVFSYEGILDDVAFMIGPSASVALAAALMPAAGLLFGGICYVAGVTVLLSSKATEPVPGWGEEAPTGERVGTDTGTAGGKPASVFRLSGTVRTLFFLMLCLGGLYGVMDTATITFSEELGLPVIASISLALQALISVASGFVFGTLRLSGTVLRQLLTVSTCIGGAYLFLLAVRGVPSFFAVVTVAALFYAPFIITCNTACEASVEGARLTEAMTWMNSGMTFGLAVGPTLAGLFIDAHGSLVGFGIAALFAALIPIIAYCCTPVLRRTLR